MATSTYNIGLKFVPDIDVAKINVLLQNLKASLGSLGQNITLLDANKIQAEMAKVDAAMSSVKTNTKTTETEIEKLNTQLGKTGEGAAGAHKGILNLHEGLSGILAVFGGGALLGGFAGIVGGLEGILEAGKKSFEVTEGMELSFKQAGLSGKALEEQMARTSDFANKLADAFAVSVSKVKEYSSLTAFLGGVTGKTNEDITQLAIAIEKASHGMISGEAAIRVFTKGAGDPEAINTLGRLKAQFPALASALEGLTTPAEKAAKAMEVLGPTMDTLKEQALGPVGSMQRLQNSLDQIKSKLGVAFITLLTPFFEMIGKDVVPAIQGIVSALSGLTGFMKDHSEIIKVATLVLGTYAVAGFVASGAMNGMAKNLVGLTTKLLSAVVGQEALNTAVLLNPYVLAAAGLVGLIAAIIIFQENTLEVAKAQLEQVKNVDELNNKQIESTESALKLAESKKDLIEQFKKEGESALSNAELLGKLKEAYPGVTTEGKTYTQVLAELEGQTGKTEAELNNLNDTLTQLKSKKIQLEIQVATAQVNVDTEQLSKDLEDSLGGSFWTKIFSGRGAAGATIGAAQITDTLVKAVNDAKDAPAMQKAINEAKQQILNTVKPEDQKKALDDVDKYYADFVNRKALKDKQVLEEKTNAITNYLNKHQSEIDNLSEGSVASLAKSYGLSTEEVKKIINGIQEAKKAADAHLQTVNEMASAYDAVNKAISNAFDPVKKAAEFTMMIRDLAKNNSGAYKILYDSFDAQTKIAAQKALKLTDQQAKDMVKAAQDAAKSQKTIKETEQKETDIIEGKKQLSHKATIDKNKKGDDEYVKYDDETNKLLIKNSADAQKATTDAQLKELQRQKQLVESDDALTAQQKILKAGELEQKIIDKQNEINRNALASSYDEQLATQKRLYDDAIKAAGDNAGAKAKIEDDYYKRIDSITEDFINKDKTRSLAYLQQSNDAKIQSNRKYLDSIEKETIQRLEEKNKKEQEVFDRYLNMSKNYLTALSKIWGDSTGQRIAQEQVLQGFEDTASVLRLNLQKQQLEEELKNNDISAQKKKEFADKIRLIDNEITDKQKGFSTDLADIGLSIADNFGKMANNAEAMKKPWKSFLMVAADALEKYIAVQAFAWATGDPTNAFLGPLAPVKAALEFGIFYALLKAIMSPIMASILSFSSGGRVDNPQLAWVGDASNARPGSDSEWVFRDDQIALLIGAVLNKFMEKVKGEFWNTSSTDIPNIQEFQLQRINLMLKELHNSIIQLPPLLSDISVEKFAKLAEIGNGINEIESAFYNGKLNYDDYFLKYLTQQNKIKSFAQGSGFIDSPTLGIVGDAGKNNPEIVLNQPQLMDIIQATSESSTSRLEAKLDMVINAITGIEMKPNVYLNGKLLTTEIMREMNRIKFNK